MISKVVMKNLPQNCKLHVDRQQLLELKVLFLFFQASHTTKFYMDTELQRNYSTVQPEIPTDKTVVKKCQNYMYIEKLLSGNRLTQSDRYITLT